MGDGPGHCLNGFSAMRPNWTAGSRHILKPTNKSWRAAARILQHCPYEQCKGEHCRGRGIEEDRAVNDDEPIRQELAPTEER